MRWYRRREASHERQGLEAKRSLRRAYWQMRWIVPAILAWTVASALSAQARIPGAPRRIWLNARWDSISAVPRDAADTILINVQNVAMADSLAVFVDFSDRSVSAVTPDGRLRWRYIKRGGGPEEISAPAAVSIAANGEIWLADRGNARGYRFTRTGRIAEVVAIPFIPERVVAISATEVAVVRSNGGDVNLIERAARPKAAPIPLPADALAAAADLTPRTWLSIAGLDGERLAVTFEVASVTLIHEGRRAPVRLVGPEGQAFPGTVLTPLGGGYFRPDIKPGSASVGWSVFALGDTLFVPTSASADGANKAPRIRAIDLYSVSQRRYLGTIKQPRPDAEGFACSRVACALLTREPEPSLSFWRMTLGR